MKSDRINRIEQNSGKEFDLAGRIIGFAMKVHGTLGFGFLESVYVKALQIEIVRGGFSVELEKPIHVRYEDVVVGDYYADLVVNGELIVEIKAVTALTASHEVQLVNYLSATGKESGLLLNFGTQSLEFKKKFRTYRKPDGEIPAFRENFVNSVNSV
jgi:GxxExxY protein